VSGKPFEVDRRVTLQWMFGAMAASGVPVSGVYAAPAAAAPPDWPHVAPPPISPPGYGTDPTLFEPVVPWPKTLTEAQLKTAAALCDTILPAEGKWPAPSAVGTHQFIDEWVSAPYPAQADDRMRLLNGFAWVEAQAQARYGKDYAALPEAARAEILGDAAKAHADGARFLERVKYLTTGAYYTSEQGVEELGYVGNVAIDGDYPGPTPDAFAHLDQALAKLNLPRRKA
jgi:hypothetical protein